MQGRLCRDDPRLGVGREGSWLLIYRYWEAMQLLRRECPVFYEGKTDSGRL